MTARQPYEILAQMRTAFAAQLPERLENIKLAIAQLKEHGSQHKHRLSLLLHNLTGAAGTFGLPRLSLASKVLEGFLEKYNETPIPPNALTEIQQHFAQIQQLALDDNPDIELEPAPTTYQKHIYIVDDDPEQVCALEKILQHNGYQTRSFSCLADFQNAITESPVPLAVIMDMIFPEGREAGAQTIANLKHQHLSNLPVIFISSRSDIHARLAAFRTGANHYLAKPINAKQLLHLLSDLALNIPSQPYHALIIDDDTLLMDYHTALLETAGFTVRCETNPLNTLDALRDFPADLLIVDMYMPECQGPELTAIIREQEKYMHLPIIFLSSETDPIKQIMALEFGGDDFLTKPINPNQFILTAKTRARRMRYMTQMLTTLHDSLNETLHYQRLNQQLQHQITKHQQTERQLRITSTAFEAQDAVMITDKNTRIICVNKAFQEVTGFSAEEVINHTPAILKSGRHDTAFYQNMWQDLSCHGKWMGEIWDKRKNGMIYPKWMSITAVYDHHGNVNFYVAVFRDISENKRAEEEIRNLAFYDALTNLPNRRLLYDKLQTAMNNSVRSQQYDALLFIDLDNFKQLNDLQGHKIGDLLLREIAKRLSSTVREVDVVARLGGDEFVVLCESLSRDQREAGTQAKVVAEKIRSALCEPYLLDNRPHHSTPSIGVALFRGHEQNIDTLFQYADIAMYRAKSTGRNNICFFDPEMHATLSNRARMETELHQALPAQQFQLHFQIQVNNQRLITGAEVLLRWNHPRHGLTLPEQFIPLAEEIGLMPQIDNWVIYAACKQLKHWESHPYAQHFNLAVNISLSQLNQKNFVEQVQQALTRTHINPQKLTFEISERIVLANFEETFLKILAIKRMGVRFSMDDFGVGYSSLIYLRRLPLDQVKIDRSFIASLSQASCDDVMALAINNIAKNFGLQVIAEGVETEEQLNILKQNACEAFQGYLFSKPLALSDLHTLLEQSGLYSVISTKGL